MGRTMATAASSPGRFMRRRSTVVPLLGRAGPERDSVLLVADEPLRDVLLELARERGYEPYWFSLPLDAIYCLVRRGERIGHALIESDLPWSDELCMLLADHYPHIRRILLA
jgi:hypothetical protein